MTDEKEKTQWDPAGEFLTLKDIPEGHQLTDAAHEACREWVDASRNMRRMLDSYGADSDKYQDALNGACEAADRKAEVVRRIFGPEEIRDIYIGGW